MATNPKGGVSVYSPARQLPIRPSGTVANAGTANAILNPRTPSMARPRPQITAPPGVAPRINVATQPQFGPMAFQQPMGGGFSGSGATGGTPADQLLASVRAGAPPAQQQQGGWRGALGTVVNSGPGKAIMGALNVLDMPRRATISTIHEISDAIGSGDASWDDWKEQFSDPNYGVGQYVDTGNIWLDRALGFGGDVLTDPMTYVLGSGVLSGVGREARLTAARAATAAGWDTAIVDRIARRGTSFLDDAQRAALRTATNEAGEHIGVNLLNRGYYFNVPFGPELRIPGTGVIEPAISSVFGRGREAAAKSGIGSYLRSRVSTPVGLVDATERLVTGRGRMSAAEAAERLNWANGYRVGHGDTLTQMREGARILVQQHGDDTLNTMINEAERGADNVVKEYFGKGADIFEGLGGTYAQGRRSDYVPHLTTPDAEAMSRGLSPESEAFLAGTVRGTSAEDISARLLSRKVEPNEKFLFAGREITLTDDLSIDGINKAFAQAFPEVKFKLLEDNFSTIAARYSADLAKDTGQLRGWKNLINSRSGLVRSLDDISDWKVDEAGTALRYGALKQETVDALKSKRDYAAQLRDAQQRRVTGIQGVIGVHMHEALDDLRTLGTNVNEELTGLLDDEQRALHFVGAVGDDGVKAPGELENRVNSYLGHLNDRAAELDAQLADISAQAARERQMYVADQARSHYIGGIEVDVRKYTALVREAKLAEQRAAVTLDQTALENVRNQLQLARTKVDVLTRNLDNESFLNLAAGPPEPRLPSPEPGEVRRVVTPANYDPATGRMLSPPEMERLVTKPMTADDLRIAGKASATRSPGQVRDEAQTLRAAAVADRLDPQTTADIEAASQKVTTLETAREDIAAGDATKIAISRSLLDEAQSEYAKVNYEISKLKGFTDPASMNQRRALQTRLEDMEDELGQLGYAEDVYESAKRELDAANEQATRATERLEQLRQKQIRQAREYDAAHPPGSAAVGPDPARELEQLTQGMGRKSFDNATRQLEAQNKTIGALDQSIDQAQRTLDSDNFGNGFKAGQRERIEAGLAEKQRQRAEHAAEAQGWQSKVDAHNAWVAELQDQAANLPRHAAPEPERLPLNPQQENHARQEVARLRRERAEAVNTKAGAAAHDAQRELESTTKEVKRLEFIVRDETQGPRARFVMDDEGNVIHREMEDTVQNISLFDRRADLRKHIDVLKADRDAAQALMAKGERGLITPEEMERATQRYARASELYTDARREARAVDSKLRRRGYDPEVEPYIGKGMSAEKLAGVIERLDQMRGQQDRLERAVQLTGSPVRSIDEQLGVLHGRLEEQAEARLRAPQRSLLTLEDRLTQINQAEAANLTKARSFAVQLKTEWEPIPPMEEAGRRAIAQERQAMGRVNLYSDEDRAALTEAYRTARSTPRKARVRENQAYQDALATIRDIEGEVGSGVSKHQAAALSQYNALRRRIDNARAGTYKAPPELTAGLEAAAAAREAPRGGNTKLAGRAQTALEAAQNVSDTQIDKLVTSGHIDQAMADDIGHTTAALEAAVERFGASPTPAAYRDVEYLISKSSIQSGTVNGLHLAHELGIEASDELGTYMLRREVAAEIASVRTQLRTTTRNVINGVEATKWATWEGEIDELRSTINDLKKVIAEQEQTKRATGKFGDAIKVTSAKKRLRTAERDLVAKQLAYPQYGAYSDSLDMLADQLYKQYESYSAAKTGEQTFSNLGRSLMGPSETRSQLQASLQYRQMRAAEAEAQNTRIRRAIDKARREGKETVRYSPTTSTREAMFVPELEAAIARGEIDERLVPLLQHKIEQEQRKAREALTRTDAVPEYLPRKITTKASDVTTSRSEDVMRRTHRLVTENEWVHGDAFEAARREGAIPERIQGPRPVGQPLEREPLSAPIGPNAPVRPVGTPPAPRKIRWDVPTKGKVVEVSMADAEMHLKFSESTLESFRNNLRTDAAELAILDGTAQREMDALTGAINEAVANGVPDPEAMTQMMARKAELQHSLDVYRTNTFGAEEMLNSAQDDGMSLLTALTSNDPAVKIPVEMKHLPILRDLLGGMAQADLAATWVTKMDEIMERYVMATGRGRRIATDRGLDLQTEFDDFIDEVRETLGSGFANAINDNVTQAMQAVGSGDLDVVGVVREQMFRALAGSAAAAKAQAQRDITTQMELLGIATGSTAAATVRQLGFDTATQRYDGWALRKYLMGKFKEMGVDIRNALPDQQQSLRARLAQLQVMNQGLGGKIAASELNDPEWLFTALRVQAEGGDLAEELKLFQRFNTPEVVGDVETRRYSQLQAELKRAISANDSDAIDVAQHQIDQMTGRAPREGSTEAVEATNEEARLEVARRASDNRIKIDALDREIGAIDELQSNWGGETLRSMIDDPNVPKPPPHKFSRAQRLQALRDSNEAAAIADAMEDRVAGHQLAEEARARAQWMSEKEQRWLNEPKDLVERANAIDEAMDAITPNSDVDIAGQRAKLAAQRDALASELDQIEAEGRLIPAAGLTEGENIDIVRRYEEAVAEFNNLMSRYKGKAKRIPAAEVPALNSLGQQIIELKARRDADVAARFAASMEGDPNFAVRQAVEGMAAEGRNVNLDWRTVFQTGIPSRDAVRARLAARKLGRMKTGQVVGERAGDQVTATTRNYLRNTIGSQAAELERTLAPITEVQERMGGQLLEAGRQKARLEGEEAALAPATERGAQLDEAIAEQRRVAADTSYPEGTRQAMSERFADTQDVTRKLSEQVDPIFAQRQQIAQRQQRVQQRYTRELQRQELHLGDVRANLETVRTRAGAIDELVGQVERAYATANPADTAAMQQQLRDLRAVNAMRLNQEIPDVGIAVIGKRRVPGRGPEGPALLDIGEQTAMEQTEALLATAARAQLYIGDAEFDARTLEQRLKQFEDGSAKVEPVMTRVVQDGWQQMAKDLFPDLGKGSDAIGVADSLASSLKNLSEALRQPESWKLLDQYTQFFKTYATMTPGFHVRNAMSGVFMNYVDGVKTRHMMHAIPLWREFEANPTAFFESLATRPDGDKIRTAFSAVLGSGAGGQFTESGLGAAPSFTSAAYRRVMNNKLTKWNRKAGSHVEGSLRLGMALDSIERGASLDQALSRITKFHFDYTQVSQLDRQAKRLIPFWTFISRNLPLQIEQMWTRPRVYLIYQSFVRNFGEVPDPFTPDYWLQQGAFTMDPNAATSEAPWYLAPDLPFTRVTEPINALIEGDIGKALLSDINPLLMAPIEAYGAHQKFYTGQPIEGYSEAQGAMKPFSALFDLLGMTETGGTSGNELMSNSAQHMIRSLLPPVNLLERLTSGTGTREGRQDETLYRALGAPVYQLTPGVRQSTRNSRAAARRNARDQQAELARS